MGPFSVRDPSAKSTAGFLGHKGGNYYDDTIGLLGEDAQAADDESSESEGSVGKPTMGSDQESGEDDAVVMPATRRQGVV
jgi:hypothetical protein